MTDPGPAASRRPIRWIVGSFLIVLVASGCVVAGFWQLRRLEERRAENALVVERSAVAVPLPASGFDPDGAGGLAHRRVTARGRYAHEREFLVRFRTRNGLPGYEVVTPFITPGGAVLVNRGWVPVEIGERWPEASAAAPEGEMTVEGVLAPAERGDVRIVRGEGPMIVGAVAPARLRGALGFDRLYELPLLLRPVEASNTFPVPIDPPDLSEGPHLSYAVQWFSFASIGVLGWLTLLRTRGPLSTRRRRVRAAAVD